MVPVWPVGHFVDFGPFQPFSQHRQPGQITGGRAGWSALFLARKPVEQARLDPTDWPFLCVITSEETTPRRNVDCICVCPCEVEAFNSRTGAGWSRGEEEDEAVAGARAGAEANNGLSASLTALIAVIHLKSHTRDFSEAAKRRRSRSDTGCPTG